MTDRTLIHNVRPNRTKMKLAEGQTCFGIGIGFGSETIVEIAAAVGCDFVIFDMEHESASLSEVISMARVADLAGMTPIARFGRGHEHLVDPLLAGGIQGFVLARVKSAADITALTDLMYYHPLGRRTAYAHGRSGNFGIGLDFDAWREQTNKELLLNVIIEEQEAVEKLDEILAHPLLDVIEVGPSDLRLSMGLPPAAEVAKIEAAIFKRAVAAGKFILDIAHGHEITARVWQQVRPGHGTMILSSVSGLVRAALHEMASAVHDRSTPRHDEKMLTKEAPYTEPPVSP